MKDTRVGEVILVLAFVYSLQFSFFPINTARLAILYIAITSILLVRNKVIFFYHEPTFRAIIPFFLCLTYAGLGVVLTGAENIAVFSNYALMLFQIGLGAYLIALFFFPPDFTLDRLLFIFLIIFTIQGILVFLNFAVPPYREFMFKILPISGNIQEDMAVSFFRVRGLMQSTGAGQSAFFSFGFFIAAYFLASLKLSKKDRTVILLSLPWILVGILFTGRTGFVMVPYAVVFYYTLLLAAGTFTTKKLLPLLWVPLIAVAIYFMLKGLYLIFTGGGIILPGGGEVLALWEKWAFGQFIDFFEGSESNIHTLEVLEKHLFIPDKDSVLLFGDPRTWGMIPSDIGYVRMLFAFGVVGLVLNYLGFICMYVQMALLSVRRNQKLFFIFYLIWMFIIEYKEPFLLMYLFTGSAMLMLFVSMRSRNQYDQLYNR
ncbi:hypothetical protein [Anseongella ginsenosidimutans]|uniref:hypothetical protein n=1 Tax=Anseongella ginsenosidimutans TaxID=496056 RepID=UPI00104F8BA9|nr:hypothetical protein [Anseongella ginsenosidimutans]